MAVVVVVHQTRLVPQTQFLRLRMPALPLASRPSARLRAGWQTVTVGGGALLCLSARFRRLVKDYERLPKTVAALYFVVVAILMLVKAPPLIKTIAQSS